MAPFEYMPTENMKLLSIYTYIMLYAIICYIHMRMYSEWGSLGKGAFALIPLYIHTQTVFMHISLYHAVTNRSSTQKSYPSTSNIMLACVQTKLKPLLLLLLLLVNFSHSHISPSIHPFSVGNAFSVFGKFEFGVSLLLWQNVNRFSPSYVRHKFSRCCYQCSHLHALPSLPSTVGAAAAAFCMKSTQTATYKTPPLPLPSPPLRPTNEKKKDIEMKRRTSEI